jgi:hypothetical protein
MERGSEGKVAHDGRQSNISRVITRKIATDSDIKYRTGTHHRFGFLGWWVCSAV